MKITAENYCDIKFQMSQFLNSEIGRYVEKSGSRIKLSLFLGESEKFVEMIIKRQSFSALERLWKRCREKMGEL